MKELSPITYKFGSRETDVLSVATRNACIVGANGSGKSSLMRKIQQHNTPSIIISAHKNLTIKQGNFRAQDDDWLRDHQAHFESPVNGGTPSPTDNNSVQADFNQVLESIFREYTDDSVAALNENKLRKDISRKLDKVFEIWNSIFIDKKLLYKAKKIKVESQEIFYDIENLSDGERCALYILIKLVLAEDKSLILIDEPETFLNPALLNELFDECEKLKPESQFIYFSHDLEFVTTRKNNTIFWIKSYQYPETWDIQPMERTNIPNELILKIIGSKKERILFVESEQNKDAVLYQLIYPGFKVWPVGSCGNVISYTKAFNSRTENFNKQYFGLVDRDLRSDAEVNSLKEEKVFSIPTAIYEGLFLRKEVIEFVFNYLGKTDFSERFAAIENEIKGKVMSENFKRHYCKSKLIDNFNKNIDEVVSKKEFIIDFTDFEEELAGLEKLDYHQILAHLNQKEIRGCTVKIGYSWEAWQTYVINILSNTEKSNDFRTKFLEFMPSII